MNFKLMNLLASAAKKAPEAAEAAKKAGEKHSSLSEILLISLVGFLTVFVVLIVLMFIISLVSKIFSDKKKEKASPVKDEAPAVAEVAGEDERVDSYTGVKLIGVSDKDAALIMAIVADGLDMPLDNLRFISIKEVK